MVFQATGKLEGKYGKLAATNPSNEGSTTKCEHFTLSSVFHARDRDSLERAIFQKIPCMSGNAEKHFEFTLAEGVMRLGHAGFLKTFSLRAAQSSTWPP